MGPDCGGNKDRMQGERDCRERDLKGGTPKGTKLK